MEKGKPNTSSSQDPDAKDVESKQLFQAYIVESDGSVFEGYLRKGLKHGKGKLQQRATNSTIFGTWDKGTLVSVHDFKLDSGEIYNGCIETGVSFISKQIIPHGLGTLDSAPGSSNPFKFEGEFHQGRIKDGSKGTRTLLKDNTVYSGRWQNGMYHGTGKLDFPNGDEYNGDFTQGKPHGKGKFTQQNSGCQQQTVYDGNWDRGIRSGPGKLTKGNKLVYEGEFKDNKFDGKGKQFLSDGAFYEGLFSKGLFHGDGCIFLQKAGNPKPHLQYSPNASDPSNPGKWVSGVKVGLFTQYLDTGETRIGLWNGELVNYTEINYADGRKYTGEFCTSDITKFHLPEGTGTLMFPENSEKVKKFDGDFVNGEPDQDKEAVIEYTSGETYEGLFQTKKDTGVTIPHGVGCMKNIGPQKWVYVGEYQNGQRHGFGELSDSSRIHFLTGKWENGVFLHHQNGDAKIKIEEAWKDSTIWPRQLKPMTISFTIQGQIWSAYWSGLTKQADKITIPMGLGTLSGFTNYEQDEDQFSLKVTTFWGMSQTVDSPHSKICSFNNWKQGDPGLNPDILIKHFTKLAS